MRLLLPLLPLCIVILMGYFETANGSDILFLAPIGSKSHKNFYNGIIYALADKGHKVTVLSNVPESKKHQNVETLLLEGFELSKFMPNVFKDKGLMPIIRMTQITPKICSESLATPIAQSLFKRKFDLVLMSMFFSDCYFSLVHHLQVPYIAVFPAMIFSTSAKLIGNPSFPSYAPNAMYPFTHPLTFFQRFRCTLQDLAMDFMMTNLVDYKMESECRKMGLCPDDMPPISEIKGKLSALLLNSIRTIEIPQQSYVPNIIMVGGIHCIPSKPLPEDLEKWVNDSGDSGFIYFSLGSATKPSDMPEQHRKTLIEVFKSLPQRVLWKWDEDNLEGLPDNVKISKWFPQQDILGHAKLQVFLTHGGLLSTQESTYHGVRVIGLPIFADQSNNMNLAQIQGWGKVQQWDDLSFDNLRNLILQVIADEKMKDFSRERSVIMKDQIRTPSFEAVYWIEYIMRYDGALHLRSPILDLPWYKLYNVDVWAFVTTIVIVLLILIILLIRCCIRCCCCRKKKLGKKKRE